MSTASPSRVPSSSVPTDSLMSLLTEQLGAEQAAKLYKEFLAPFYSAVKQHTYPLPLPADLTEEVLKAKMQSALAVCGVNCERVVLLSLSNPFPKPEWMTKEAYEAILPASLLASLRAILPASLLASLWDSLRASLLANLWAILPASLRDSLYLFLGFHLAKKPEEAKKLEALIRLLPFALVLREKADEPGVWIVAVA